MAFAVTGNHARRSSTAKLARLASSSALALCAAAWATAASSQCAGPSGGVYTCPSGTYGGIFINNAANPSTTVNIPAGVTITTFGVGVSGNGTITINGDPSDSFTSALSGVPGLYGLTNVGNVNLTGGSVVGGAGNVPAVVANTNAGDVLIDVASASSPAQVGIVVGNNGSGGPGNVSVTAGNVTGPVAGIDIITATGDVVANVTGTVSSSGGPAVYIVPNGSVSADNVTVNVANSIGDLGAVNVGGTGKVVVNSGNATTTYTGSPSFPTGAFVGFGIIASSSGGSVQITSGNVTTNSANPSGAILGIASGDVVIQSGSAIENGGGFAANLTEANSPDTLEGSIGVYGVSVHGNVTITSGVAKTTGGTGADAVYASAFAGSANITSGDVSTTGDGAIGIVALAAGDVQIRSTGNITTGGGLFQDPGGVTGGAVAPYVVPAVTFAADGILAQSSGGNVTITAGNISTSGASADGIVANAAGTGNITVTGNVSSALGRGIALASGGSSTVTVQAGASVSGVIGIDASGSSTGYGVGNNTAGVQGGLTVVDDGTITGTGGTAIVFGAGYNTLTLGPGAVINGNIVGVVSELDGGAGASVSVPTGATLSLAGGNFSGDISGAGSLEKVGNGTLTLSGVDSIGGNFTVGSGAVSVTGSLSAPQLFVDSGAVLGGTGAIAGNVTVEPGGIFSPGDPVTTTIHGNLLFASGSLYLAQVLPGGAGKSGAPGDLIAVTGVVTIKPGATFAAWPLGNPASYANNTQYVVITATGGVVGTFSNVVSEAPLLSASLIYPHDQVVLKLKRNDKSFASQAITPDQAAAAAAVEAGGADSPLYMALVGQTALGLQQGYASLSGEGYADETSVMLEQSDQNRRSLVSRMDQPAQANGLWVATFGQTQTADAGANFAHARTTLGGGESGLDLTFHGWRIGLATGFGYDSLSISARTTSTLDSFWNTSAYAAYDRGPFDVKFGATYTWHRLTSTRDVVFPGFAEANRSLSHLSSSEAFAEAGWSFRTARGWIEPFAGLSVDTLSGYTASEAGGESALGVTTSARTVITERLGVLGETSLFGSGLTLHGALDWRHAGGDLSGAARLTFQGTGQSFAVRGLPIAADAAEVTASVSGKAWWNTKLDVSYHGEVGDHFSDNALKLHASWAF